MPDKEMIFNRLNATVEMMTILYERLEGKADVSTVEMVWGIRDYLEHAIEDVQALVLALESRNS